jgi:hypothetical protein
MSFSETDNRLSRSLRRGAASTLPLLLIAGCGSGSNTPTATKTVTVTETVSVTPTPASTPTPSASPTPSGSKEAQPFAPNVGPRALTIGQTRQGSGFETTVYAVNQHPTPPSYMDPPGASLHWVTVRAKQCARPAQKQPVEIDWTQYVLEDNSDGQYEANGSSWNDWPPLPQYPRGRKISRGACGVGWMLFSVPNGTKVTRVALSDGAGGLAAEWEIPS